MVIRRARAKHWEFWVNAWDIEPVIAPAIVASYADEHEKRTAVLASWIATQISCGAIDFAHDPDSADAPELDRQEVLDAFARLTGDSHGWETILVTLGDFEGEHDVQLMFVDPDPEGFGAPVDTSTLARHVTDALEAAVADGRIPVSADEPYDSCRGCGGYHNVNYDCR